MEATLTAFDSSDTFFRQGRILEPHVALLEVRPQENELEESTSREKKAGTNAVRWSWLHALVMSVALLGLCILMGVVMGNMRSSGRGRAEARLALRRACISATHPFH